MTTTALAMAPIASALCQRLNCRWVSLGGSLLAFTGMTLSAFMPNLETLFLTLGLLTGAGVGLATTPGIILTARYFDKKRSRANALCLSGAAAGAFTLPMFFTFLIDTYGFRGALPVIGACLLHISISAALYRSNHHAVVHHHHNDMIAGLWQSMSTFCARRRMKGRAMARLWKALKAFSTRTGNLRDFPHQ